jgi:hypothetical protein
MKVGRNSPCSCGSGKKYKHCCYDKDLAARQASAAATLEAAEAGPSSESEVDDNADSTQPAQEQLSFQERQRLEMKGRNYPNSVASKPKT